MNISKESLLAVMTPGLITMGLIALCLMVLSLPAQARIKCWETDDLDEQGKPIRACGDKIPPEYAQKSHKEISSQGVTVGESARAKTKEELVEDRRLAAIQEEEDRKKAEIEKQDKILLDTYSNTDDIQMTSDGKIAALESTIKLANKLNEKIQANLDKRIAEAAAAELAGKQPTEDLLKDIESLQRQIKNNDKFIVDKHKEQEAIKKEYADKIAHFEELTGKKK